MKFSDLQEDGRIVKGVNTTVDVGTGQVSKEANKLVGKVNKDGYPPELHSKAKKNSKPNTLYNLGLAEALIQESQPNTPEPERYTALEWAAIEGGHTVENVSHTGTATAHAAKKKKLKPGDDAWFKHWFSLPYFMKEGYKLELERDTRAGLLVLNILDTKTGKRTEVRGKPGYESGNYDPNDPLHQLIDRLGKAVDISQLMNGEPVGINPKHPDGEKAKAATDVAYNENFADGKVKGKSRPGRVKRSGASCKGSVTDLRAKAKKYSGERGKMYHWCANMKSGRKKK